ncbi:MAG: hypothetical protein Q4Q25_02440, partial [Methanocorpusculum sp.]|nr:hypothetical protein [Methanocorpusculum sp.]
LIYLIMCFRNRKNHYFLYAVALLSVNCMIAHHLLALEYNVFTLAYFASLDSCEKRKLSDTPV